MTTNIRINDKNNTIEITKKFASAAKRFGTDEYNDLQVVRKDYPNYRVEIKTSSKKADCFKGLTFGYMEMFIRTHNDELLKDFFLLCGKDENGEEKEMAPTASYGEIKQWFLTQFPEVTLQRKAIDKILNKKTA